MARSFNGSTQYCETSAFLSGSLPCTISAWFYCTSTSGFQRVATWGNYDTSAVVASIILNYPSAGDVANQVTPPAALPYKGSFTANAWQHAAVVSETTAARVYLNGAAGADVTYSVPASYPSTYFTVGKVVSTQYLNGRACHVAVWNVALTAAEAADLAAGCHPRRIRPASLVAHYAFGGFEGDYDRDLAGGYHLTPSGSPTFADQPRIIYPQGPLDVQLAASSPPAATPWLYARHSARIIGGGLS